MSWVVGLLLLCAVASSFQQAVFLVEKYYEIPWKVNLTPIEVAVYYESKCPDSQEFIIDQLLPTFLKGPQLISPILIPYGKAQTYKTREGYKFTCQHGPSECLGNKIHACAINIIQRNDILLRYISCMINHYDDPESIGEKCAVLYGIDWNEINICSKGRKGSELLRRYGKETAALNPPVSFIPTVTLNGNQGNQTAILSNLWGEICKAFKEHKPVECRSSKMRPLITSSTWK